MWPQYTVIWLLVSQLDKCNLRRITNHEILHHCVTRSCCVWDHCPVARPSFSTAAACTEHKYVFLVLLFNQSCVHLILRPAKGQITLLCPEISNLRIDGWCTLSLPWLDILFDCILYKNKQKAKRQMWNETIAAETHGNSDCRRLYCILLLKILSVTLSSRPHRYHSAMKETSHHHFIFFTLKAHLRVHVATLSWD